MNRLNSNDNSIDSESDMDSVEDSVTEKENVEALVGEEISEENSSETSAEAEKSTESEHHHHHHHSSSTGESEAEIKSEDESSVGSDTDENKTANENENTIQADTETKESKSHHHHHHHHHSNTGGSESVTDENKTADENKSTIQANTETQESKSHHHHHHHSIKGESGKSSSHHHSSKSTSTSSSHHHSSSSSSSGKSESSSHYHSSSSGKSESSGHHHHHHHHHSSKESEHEYEVSYGKYNFSVNPDDEDVPVAKYRKISKRKQEQEKRKKEQEKEKKKNPRSKAFIMFIRVSIALVSVLLIIVISLITMIVMGKNSLLDDNKNVKVRVPASVELFDDYIIYKGHKYKYNNNVTTILFSGIDKETKEHNDEIFGTAGQADAIFVLALDTSTGSYKLMALSRDSMVDVNICDAAGNFKGTKKMQICLAHAYGDGAETSNLNLKRSISRLFFGIPVNAYMSVDLDVIPILNDDVGGVTVNVIEDLTNWNPLFKKGETIVLHGNQAETYVRARDVTGDENQNNLRMERQKGYIDGFVDNALSLTRRDFSTPILLYSDIADYSRTDIDATKISYLASVFLQRGFSSEEDLVKIPGKTVMGEKYAEYHVDTEAFFDIIIQAYYIRID